ncbi:MAG: hypothetical protein PVF85_05230 [Anaerolineales bacterium]|jgi:hypothetical protein
MSQLTQFLGSYRFLPAIAAPCAAIAILLIERRSLKIYLLAFQYAMVSWLVVMTLSLESALAKLVAGLIAVFILYMGAVWAAGDLEYKSHEEGFPRGRVFRVTAILLVVIGTIGLSSGTWLPVDSLSPGIRRAAMLLVFLGILGVGLYVDTLQIGISLITVVSGFEIIYSALEPSLAVIALLALVHLGIALVIGYFEIVSIEAEQEGEPGR